MIQMMLYIQKQLAICFLLPWVEELEPCLHMDRYATTIDSYLSMQELLILSP